MNMKKIEYNKRSFENTKDHFPDKKIIPQIKLKVNRNITNSRKELLCQHIKMK